MKKMFAILDEAIKEGKDTDILILLNYYALKTIQLIRDNNLKEIRKWVITFRPYVETITHELAGTQMQAYLNILETAYFFNNQKNKTEIQHYLNELHRITH